MAVNIFVKSGFFSRLNGVGITEFYQGQDNFRNPVDKEERRCCWPIFILYMRLTQHSKRRPRKNIYFRNEILLLLLCRQVIHAGNTADHTLMTPKRRKTRNRITTQKHWTWLQNVDIFF